MVLAEMVLFPLRRTAARLLLALALVASVDAAPPDWMAVTRLQVFLDNHHFSPGMIDGDYGTFTKRALAYYNTHRRRKTTDWQTPLILAEREIPVVFATHRLTRQDFRWLGVVPKQLALQEKQRSLPYTTISEFLSERYHVDKRFLQRLNPRVDLRFAKVGDLVVVPKVKHVFRIEALPRSKSYRATRDKSECYVLVDTKARVASIYRGTQMLAAFPITHGRERFVPRGRWRITKMVTTPNFRWDERMLKEGQRSQNYYTLPPGPNNPVGVLWASINKRGIGLHGTNSPETIGRAHSAGCIRFNNWDAIRLPMFVCPGSEVIVR